MNDGAVVSATISERKKEDKAARLKIQEFSLRNAIGVCCVELTTRTRAGEMPNLRSRSPNTCHVVQNLR